MPLLEDVHQAARHNLTVSGTRMLYKPLNELDAARLGPLAALANAVQGEGLGSVLPAAVQRDPQRTQLTRALFCLALGGLDEAHDLVTPLSLSHHTHTGGEPIPPSSLDVRRDACAIHGLVHLMEGPVVGELGSAGFDNALHWLAQADIATHTTHADLQRAAATRKQHIREPEAVRQVERYLPGGAGGCKWSAEGFVSLCRQAAAGDAELLAFSDGVVCDWWEALVQLMLVGHTTGHTCSPGMVGSVRPS